jgi:hypothetical protein
MQEFAGVKEKMLAHGQPGVTLSSTLDLLENLMRHVHRVNSQPSGWWRVVSFFTDYRPRKYAAVFIDEVQAEGKLALEELFQWAVEFNKDKATGHVFFASSDAFFLQFMRNHLLKPEYLDVFVVDDAPLDSAKAVLEKAVKARRFEINLNKLCEFNAKLGNVYGPQFNKSFSSFQI